MQKCLLRIFVFVILSSGFLFVNKGYSEEEEFATAFNIANNFYQQGKYSEAITEYNKILNKELESAPLLFNIANAYYKSGKIGKAIVNYERALRLTPRDADIRANLKYAKKQIKGRAFNDRGLWAWRPLKAFVESFTINELTIVSSGLYLFILLIGFLAIVRPELRKILLLIISLSVILVLCGSFVVWHKAGIQDKHAVVIVPESDAMFGPFEAATKFFKLYEGMSVIVLRSKDGWDKIRRADGKVGWVKKDVLEVV